MDGRVDREGDAAIRATGRLSEVSLLAYSRKATNCVRGKPFGHIMSQTESILVFLSQKIGLFMRQIPGKLWVNPH